MNILIVKLSSLGDVIQTMPVVHDMLARFPSANIDWMVEESFAPLVSRLAGVRRVLPIAQRRWRKSRWSATTRAERAAFDQMLSAQNYDAVIDFQGLIKSALEARRARLNPGGFSATYGNASEACGYEWPVRLLLQRHLPMPGRIHAVARYRLLAGLALGYVAQGNAVYALSRPTGARQATVVLAHGTTRADNEWPEADWLELARHLNASGLRVALPQSNATELERVTRIAQALGGQADIWPRLSLPEVMDRMALSAGVIGVDSGLSHLAVALDLPHVQIYNFDTAWRTGPQNAARQCCVFAQPTPSLDAVWQAWLAVCGASRP